VNRIFKTFGIGVSVLLIFVALSGHGPSSTLRAAAALTDVEPGGSNYVLYSVGRYLTEPSEKVWYAPGNMRPVIGTYEQDPGMVEYQLRAMWANGQRKVALVLFYGDFTPDLRIRDSSVFGHVVNARTHRLVQTQEANLVQVLRLIRSIGYDEIVFRFATSGISDPRDWSGWVESRYRTNLAFIVNTKAVIDAELRDGTPKVLYDLEVGLAGITTGQARPYTVRLWRDFTNGFGADHTIGFSFALAPGRITEALSAFDEVGVRPPQYGLQIYDDEFQALTAATSELSAANELAKPIVILEAYYNDMVTALAVRQAREQLQLNIRTLFQWPIERTATQPHFSMHYPPEFASYLTILSQ
jgi:hypothetical protein